MASAHASRAAVLRLARARTNAALEGGQDHERQGLCLVVGPMRTQFLRGLETWFTLPDRPGAPPPPPHKMALRTWITIFPLITVVVIVLEPLLESLAVVPRLAITTAVTVPIMTWLVMPRVTRLLRGGSTPSCPRLRRRRPRTRVAGRARPSRPRPRRPPTQHAPLPLRGCYRGGRRIVVRVGPPPGMTSRAASTTSNPNCR